MKDYTYQNTLVSKKQLKDILAWSFTKYGSVQASFLADELKYLGFKYATQAGISISIEDLRVPYVKNLILLKANQQINHAEISLLQGQITDIERFQKIIDIWIQRKGACAFWVHGRMTVESHEFINGFAINNNSPGAPIHISITTNAL